LILAFSSAIIFIFSGFLFGKNFILYSLLAAIIFYFLPVEVIKNKILIIRKKILGELPDIVDMLSSLIKAGLTLDEAMTYISRNYNSETSKLFRMLHTKILEGYSKPEAFNIIARLSFCSEFKNLIKVLAQSEIIGNPVKDILKDLSRVMRENQRDFLKMKAEKLESNLIIVIFIFIFIPVIALFLIPVIPQLQILF
jgi:tight adherence protein C